jgi:guanylate kinase
MRKRTIVTLTGPTCSGKTTLEGLLRAEGFAALTSTTTRQPREGEVDGQSYHFIDNSMFNRLSVQGAFIEEVKFGGNRYGLSVKEVKDKFTQGKDVVLVCEPIGLAQIRKWAQANGVPHVAVYVDNPPQVIAERFLKRAGIDIAEAMIHKSPDDTAAMVKNYAGRLKEMLTTEQRWAETAGSDVIDLYVPVFERENEESVIRVIKSKVLGLAGVHPIQQVAA